MVSIPLIKDKTGNFNDMDNYRAITLSPVISKHSKLFEMVVLEICSDAMSKLTDPLQFGFKSNIGYADAIFTSLLSNTLLTEAAQSILPPLILEKRLIQ